MCFADNYFLLSRHTGEHKLTFVLHLSMEHHRRDLALLLTRPSCAPARWAAAYWRQRHRFFLSLSSFLCHFHSSSLLLVQGLARWATSNTRETTSNKMTHLFWAYFWLLSIFSAQWLLKYVHLSHQSKTFWQNLQNIIERTLLTKKVVETTKMKWQEVELKSTFLQIWEHYTLLNLLKHVSTLSSSDNDTHVGQPHWDQLEAKVP